MVIKERDIKEKVRYYMDQPYNMTVKFRPEQGGYYVASYTELPDLTMTGDTEEEAVRDLLAEKAEWFEACLERDIPIPMPVKPKTFSGKILVRTTPSLHESLNQLAELEGVSLNQYVIAKLAQAVGKEENTRSKTR